MFNVRCTHEFLLNYTFIGTEVISGPSYRNPDEILNMGALPFFKDSRKRLKEG